MEEKNKQEARMTFDLNALSLNDVIKSYETINEFLSVLSDLKIDIEEVEDDE